MMNAEKSQYQQWIEAFILVSFDVNEGQKISLVVPPIKLSPSEEKEIAMLAFPDSNSYSEYEGVFKYIFKLQNGCLGFVCFKQKKDQMNSRGYSQKSFITLSRLPFINFYEKLSEFLVFKLFSLEVPAIQQILIKCYTQQIMKWPEPHPLQSYTLTILEYELSIEIPNYSNPFTLQNLVSIERHQKKIKEEYHKSKKHNIDVNFEDIVKTESNIQFGIYQEIKIIEIFKIDLEIIWNAWECVILNKNLIIMSESPHEVSQAVLGCISLINPIQFYGEFSPYLTIYDSNLEKLQNKTSGLLLGCTNPIFNKLFKLQNFEIINLKGKGGGQGKIKKHLKPVKQLMMWKTQSQKAINESSLRKYFYKASKSVLLILEEYLELQPNDLKFFNAKDFIRYLKHKDNYESLELIFTHKKYIITFFEQFVHSNNFKRICLKNNVVIEKS